MSAHIEIVLAYYNGSAFIDEQLDSIQRNILPADCKVDITIIDDFSKNDEFDKLLSAASKWPNVKLVRNDRNLGVIRTFEKGIAGTSAPYVMLSDQDDVWLPEKIRLSLEKIREIEGDGPAMVFTDVRTVDTKLNTISERMLGRDDLDPESQKHQLLFQNMVTGCTVIMNRKLIGLALPFPAGIPMHDHWLAVCAAFGGRLGFVNQATILYRQHPTNLVGQPQRRLISRASRPYRTILQFNKGLIQKAHQAIELSRRLADTPERKLTAQAGEALQRRSLKHLRFLIRTRVFPAEWPALPLLCLLYLMPMKRPTGAKDHHA